MSLECECFVMVICFSSNRTEHCALINQQVMQLTRESKESFLSAGLSVYYSLSGLGNVPQP